MVILILWFVICDAKTYYRVDYKELHDEQGTTTETEPDSDALDEDLLDRMRRYLTPQTTSLNMRDVLNQFLARTDMDELTYPASKALSSDITLYNPESVSNEGMFLEYDTQVTPFIDYNTIWPKLFRFKPTNQDNRLNDGLHEMPFKVKWLNRTTSTTPKKENPFLFTTSRRKRTDKKYTGIPTKTSRNNDTASTRSKTRSTTRRTKSVFKSPDISRKNPSKRRSRSTKNTVRKPDYIISTIFLSEIHKKSAIRPTNTHRRNNSPRQMNLTLTRTTVITKPTRRNTFPNLIVDIVSEDDQYEDSITEKKKILPLGVKPYTAPLEFFDFSREIATKESYTSVTQATDKTTDDSPFIIDLLESKRGKPTVFLGLNTTLIFPEYDLDTFDSYKKKDPTTTVDNIMKKIQAALPQNTTKSTMDRVEKEKWPALQKWFKEVFPKGLIELVPESMSDVLSEKSEDEMSDIDLKEATSKISTSEIEDGKATQWSQFIRKYTVTEPPTTIDIIKQWNIHRKFNIDTKGDIEYEPKDTFVHQMGLGNSTETIAAVFMTPIIIETATVKSVSVYDSSFVVRPLALIPTESFVKQFEKSPDSKLDTDFKDKTEVPEGEAMYMDSEVTDTVQPGTEDLVKDDSLKEFSSSKDMPNNNSESLISAPNDLSTEFLLINSFIEVDGSNYSELSNVNSSSNKEIEVPKGGFIGLIERGKDQTITPTLPGLHAYNSALRNMIANLTDGWSRNILQMINESLLRQNLPKSVLNQNDESVSVTKAITTDDTYLTIDTTDDLLRNNFEFNSTEDPFQVTEDVFTVGDSQNATSEDALSNATGVLMGKCFVCGLIDPKIPYDTQCSDAFTSELIPMVPMKAKTRQTISSYRKYCLWKNVRHYEENKNRRMLGRWTGGCSVRWIDLHGMYTQRTCRNKYEPVMGKHYLSKRMAVLELALKHSEDACIVSPVASLVPLSRGISLYARFHACVCSGNWCNQATFNYQRTTNIALLSLILECMWMT